MHNFNKKLSIGLLALAVLSPINGIQPALASGSGSAPTSSAPATQSETHSVKDLKFIDSQTIPNNTQFGNTKVGGISGITYNPNNNKWLLLSDDRSEQNASRFYEAQLNYNHKQFKHLKLKKVHTLKQANGETYTDKKHFKKNSNDIVADPESIRFDPLYNQILYTSEGDRTLGLNPFIRFATTKGDFISDIPINPIQKMDKQKKQGFRNNLALEGSTFSTDGQSLWTSMEAPLLQDGAEPTPTSGGQSRITQYDRAGNLLTEFAYPLDAIPKAPGKGKHAENGVSEILAISDHEFLTLERASVQASDDSFKNYVRIYKVNTQNATDIKHLKSVKDGNIRPVKKQLIANLNSKDIAHIDNIEGMSFGKKLPNGHDSLVIAADDNFNKAQKSQFLAFEVIPES